MLLNKIELENEIAICESQIYILDREIENKQKLYSDKNLDDFYTKRKELKDYITELKVKVLHYVDKDNK